MIKEHAPEPIAAFSHPAGGGSYFFATNVPIGDVTTRPSSFSASRAFRTVVSATPKSWAMVTIDGSLPPGGYSPPTIRAFRMA
jgi:hypothetical protein